MKRGLLVGFAFLVFCLSFSSEALAFKKVYSPLVHKGELELEYRGAVDFDKRKGFDDGQEQKFAVGYGVTDWWFTEVYGEISKEAREEAEEGETQDRSYQYTATEWENLFQLTEQGKYWLDLGLLTEYEWAYQPDGKDHLEIKILLEKEWGNFVHRLNANFEKETDGGELKSLEPGFAWQTLCRVRQEFQPGFEVHSNFGPVDEGLTYQEQEHFIGPVVEGSIFKKIKYNVGYLFGLTDSTPRGELKWTLEWEQWF